MNFIIKYRLNIFLLIFSICLIAPGLWALEFFRHTEADRVLIAIEMIRRGDFIVPHLLGTPILTKPPLFYWLLASFFSLFSSNSEFVSRIPSAIFAVALVQLLFVFLKKAGINTQQAFLSSLILLTSPLFLQISTTAEIDLTFSCLISLSLFSLYLSFESNNLKFLVVAYLLGGLATLTKGPIAAGIIILVDFLWAIINWERLKISQFILSRLLGGVILIGVFSAWLYPVLKQIQSEDLFNILGSEISRRFHPSSASESKGFLFYLQSLLLGSFPWSILAILGLIKFRKTYKELYNFAVLKFSALCAGLILLVLTIAHGKASRYSLPAYPFLAIIFAPLVQAIFLDLKIKTESKKMYWYAGGIVAAATILTCIYCPGSSLAIVTGGLLLILSIYLVKRYTGEFILYSLSLCLILVIFIRFGETICYSQIRNKSKSVGNDVIQIANVIKQTPSVKNIFGLEFIERWYAYYLEHEGVSTFLLHPQSNELLKPDDQIYLMLSKQDELWRIPQLQKADPNTSEIKLSDKSQIVLISTSARAVSSLNLQSGFPTDLTIPK